MRNGINLTAKTNVTITIYNLNGKLISRQSYNAGNHSISLGHLPKGVYIVKMSHGSEKQILQIPVR
jgi:flagellar hook assembly protein FlgD